MTPQELERMPDQGLEFEQSVGPKESSKTKPPSPVEAQSIGETSETSEALKTSFPSATGSRAQSDELTLISVVTSVGKKVRI